MSKSGIAALLVLALLGALPCLAGEIYWTEHASSRIQRANLDGGGVETVLQTGSGAFVGIALDLDNGKLYWADRVGNRIQRANLDGSAVEDVVSGLDQPREIALDLAHGRVYWSETEGDVIRRAGLDGSNVEDVVLGSDGPMGIALDLAAGKMYWCASLDNAIRRASLDGAGVEDLLFALTASGIALDLPAGKLYWSEYGGAQKVSRADLDGANPETLVEGAELVSPRTVALDLPAGKLYWADKFSTPGAIRRSNLDGTAVETVVETVVERIALALAGVCGDGVVDRVEDCDDGGNASCDGCSPHCAFELGLACGDGIHNTACEDCDDGNALDGDSCPANCTYVALHDQTDDAAGGGRPDQRFEAIYGAYDSEGADDFVITQPQGWQIRRLDTVGSTSKGGVVIHVDVAFYPDLAGIPDGQAVCEFPGVTTFTHDFGDLTITLPSDCDLPPGHWWVAQQVRMNYGPLSSQHFWSNRSTQTHHEGVWRNPGNGFTSGCPDWTPQTACNLGGENGPDFLFRLLGGDDGDAPGGVPTVGPFGAALLAISLAAATAHVLTRRKKEGNE